MDFSSFRRRFVMIGIILLLASLGVYKTVTPVFAKGGVAQDTRPTPLPRTPVPVTQCPTATSPVTPSPTAQPTRAQRPTTQPPTVTPMTMLLPDSGGERPIYLEYAALLLFGLCLGSGFWWCRTHLSIRP